VAGSCRLERCSSVIEDALVRDVLVDETQPAGRVHHDVAHAVLTMTRPCRSRAVACTLHRAPARPWGLLPQRRLHDRGLLKDRREDGHAARGSS